MSKLTHLSDTGEARMVDVGAKSATARKAIAQGRIKMSAVAFKAVRDGNGPKGDVLGPARIAGIMAGKRTSELIPLCHPLPLDFVGVDFALDEGAREITATAEARTSGKTGVEMEALTAVSVALLTIYDMAKAVDRAMEIGGIHLLEKTGGVRGDYRASDKS